MKFITLGPKSCRAEIAPLGQTGGVTVSRGDWEKGLKWGGHWLEGVWWTWEQLAERAARAAGNRSAVIGEAQARLIRRLRYVEGQTQKEIADSLHQSYIIVRRVCTGESYWWAGWDRDDTHYRRAVLCCLPHSSCGSPSQTPP